MYPARLLAKLKVQTQREKVVTDQLEVADEAEEVLRMAQDAGCFQIDEVPLGQQLFPVPSLSVHPHLQSQSRVQPLSKLGLQEVSLVEADHQAKAKAEVLAAPTLLDTLRSTLPMKMRL